MEISKHFKNGFLLTHSPFPFKHKHLSLSKQRKDKEIKKEREELEKKRKEFEEIKGKWSKEEVQFKVATEKRKEENLRLIMQEEKLKNDLFKLSIRKDQIQSRTNPKINIDKANIIKRYLKCVPYTAGKRLESIKFWNSESRYLNLKFLLELAVDRFFGRSKIQTTILGNLSRIVFCKKIRFGNQWIMFCIKQPVRGASRYYCKTSKKSNRSLYHPDSNKRIPEEKRFELIIYSISGKYFQLNRFYTEEELKSWVDVSAQVQPVLNHHRLSVADNLAKINALKALSENSLIEPNLLQGFQKQSLNSVQSQFKVISEEVVTSSQNSDLNDDTQDEIMSQANSEIEKKVSNDESTPQKTEQNISQSELDMPTPTLTPKTRKSMQLKSWFYIRGKNEPYACKYNREFLSGYQTTIFPQNNPLLNIVILKQKKQLYLLQEYIQMANKKMILDMAVARFKLKMKIKAELKKCLYYKKEIINICEETIMAEEKSIELPCLFILKKCETTQAHEIYISCDSLISHPQIENGLQIKALIHRVVKEKQEIREEKILARNSNLKNIKSSSLRKSRQSKRRSNSRNPSKVVSIEHEKSGFGANKKPVQNWVAFSSEIIEKYKKFVNEHVISIQKRRFIHKDYIKRKMMNIIRIQNKFRMTLSKRILNEAKQTARIKCVWRQEQKVLVTASLLVCEKKIKVYFEKVEIGCLQSIRCLQYETINWQTICNTIDNTQHQGTFTQITQNTIQLLKVNISRQTERRLQLQKQKPQRYKKMIESFLFMVSLRLRARKNIFFIKKMIIKERIFVLLIRRDKHVKSLLQCNLYDMLLPKETKELHEGKTSETAFSKQERQLGSEYGSHKPAPRSRPDLDDKIYKYQKIFLMEQYFQNIDTKQIVDQFYIEKGVFLLKPPKAFNIFYIDRLNTLDMNSEEFLKEFSIFEKQDMQKSNEDRISQNITNNSLKKLIILNNSNVIDSGNISKLATQTQSREAAANYSKIRARKESRETSKKEKKTSIQKHEKEIFTFLKSNLLKENVHNSQTMSKKSFGESISGKATRQIFQIKNNSHESIVYYSLYKSDNVFFYLELFIVSKTIQENSYHQELVSLEKYRLYKKQLQEASSSLFFKKLAAWTHENDEQLIRLQQRKEKVEDLLSKKGESTNNLVTLQFFSALMGANKRLSYEMANSLIFQKQTRTNTLSL